MITFFAVLINDAKNYPMSDWEFTQLTAKTIIGAKRQVAGLDDLRIYSAGHQSERVYHEESKVDGVWYLGGGYDGACGNQNF